MWASWCEIDETAHGSGKVIPSGQVQSVQNLEGGIIKKIHVSEGDLVEAGQVLLEMDDTRYISNHKELSVKIHALCARLERLKAETQNYQSITDRTAPQYSSKLMQCEISLHHSKQQELESGLAALGEQFKQKKKGLSEVCIRKETLQQRLKLLKEELALSKALERHGAVSHIEALALERQVSDTYGEMQMAQEAAKSMCAQQQEILQRINEKRLTYCSNARTGITRTLAQLNELEATQSAVLDQIQRAQVKAPVKSIVNRVFVSTEGSVVQPGVTMVELTPLDDTLEVEVKIPPDDIAFLYLAQKVVIRLSAFDVTQRLTGELTYISADSIQDKRGKNYYLARVKAQDIPDQIKGSASPVIIGMTATVDILIGKKNLLDFLLRPILQTLRQSFTER